LKCGPDPDPGDNISPYKMAKIIKKRLFSTLFKAVDQESGSAGSAIRFSLDPHPDPDQN